LNRLIYFFIWSVRVKGWTFGFGPLFSVVGKGVDAIKGAAKRLFKKKKGTKSEVAP